MANPIRWVPPPINSAKLLAREGHLVLLVGYVQQPEDKQVESLGKGARLFRLELKSRKLKLALLRHLLAPFEFWWRTRLILRRYQPSVLLCFNEVATILLLFIKKYQGIKLAWYLEFPERFLNTLHERVMFRWALRALNQSDACVFPSQVRMAMTCALRPELIERPLFTVHNAPLLRHSPTAEGEANAVELKALAFFEANATKTKLVYTGAVGNKYGLDSIIAAVADKEDCCLLVLGGANDSGRNDYTAAMTEAGEPERVYWPGSVPYDRLAVVLAEADVGFVSYRGDSLNTYFSAPGKAYEYLAQGLVLLADDGISIASEVTRAKAGLTFSKPYGAKELTEQLNKLNHATIETMKANSLNLFEHEFNMDFQCRPIINWLDNYN